MRKTILSTLVLSAFVAGSAGAAPTQYDNLQDIDIHAARMQADSAQQNAMTNRNDIAVLKGQTNGAIAATNSALQQVNQQQAAVNQAQGTLINNNTAQIAKVDGKADAALGLASSALNLAGSAKTDASKALQGVATNGAAITKLQQQQGDFVTKTDYQNGQNAQDKAQNDEATARVNGDKALQSQIDTKADKAQVNSLAVSMLKHDAAQQKLIDQNKADIATKVSQSDFDQAKKDQAQTDRDQDHLTQQLHADTQAKLAGKVDTSVFTADQVRQDKALADETAARKAADNRLAVDMIKHDQAQQKILD